MRFITVRELRSKSAEIWRQLPDEGELVITSNGKPIAILTPTSDRTLEESLKQIRAAQAGGALDQLQRSATRRGLNRLSSSQIDSEIKASRNERRR